LSGVEEAGCVLVRPDLYVAWRSRNMVEKPVAELRRVLKSVLSLQ
jgi:2,4-dichlorophenol 6-monooxygenase